LGQILWEYPNQVGPHWRPASHPAAVWKAPDGDDDDYGVIVVIRFGVDKDMKKHLSDKETKEVEDAMKEVVKVPRSAKPECFRL
jgi:hypothetical protein